MTAPSGIEPHLDSAALLTIDVQIDTLGGGAVEIPGTSTAVPRIARSCHRCSDARAIWEVAEFSLRNRSRSTQSAGQPSQRRKMRSTNRFPARCSTAFRSRRG
jgi:hypothetical protein